MNRMGGVGRGRSQFNVGGVNHPDGTRPCKDKVAIRQWNKVTNNYQFTFVPGIMMPFGNVVIKN
jgi:hypothetical protein